MADEILFQERQRHTQWWGWLPILVLGALCAFLFYRHVVEGLRFELLGHELSTGVVWTLFLLFSVVSPIFLVTIRLTTVVVPGEVRVRWWPLWTRRIPAASIEHVEARTFRAFREYGGYGPQWTPWRGWSYAAVGDRGVQLKIKGKHPTLIGSQCAEDLAAAIETARA